MCKLKNLIKSIIASELIRKNELGRLVCRKIVGNTMMFINHDLTEHQQRILVSFVSPLHTNFNRDALYHPLYAQVNQILKCLIELNFSIDICDYNDLFAYKELAGEEYDYVIGFGKVYKEVLLSKKAKKSILFVTENLPEVVEKKYKERISYFKERHPNLPIVNVPRNDCFDMEQFILSDMAIVMSSDYNIQSMRKYIQEIYPINVNCLYNSAYTFDTSHIKGSKRNFLWFGSQGTLHKGLDILIDAFKQLPEYTLNIYGVPENEKRYIKPLLSKNTILHERVNVLSQDFIDKVVKQNVFVLSASCSEGMMSGIATCMIHGLIPIVTKETSYNSCSCIFEFDGYKVEDILKKIKQMDNLKIADLEKISKECQEYAKDNFLLSSFKKSMKQILPEYINQSRSVYNKSNKL